ncbi:hypothetical protein JYT28_01750 [Desulfobulbus sp. AH-315-M07]|nr:hypothetical protein [Desulfobulbus sp. AH-315-M07]
MERTGAAIECPPLPVATTVVTLLVGRAFKAVQSVVLGSIPGASVVLVVAIFIVSALVRALSLTASATQQVTEAKEVAMENNKQDQKKKPTCKLIVRSSLLTLATMGTALGAGAALP